MTCDAIKMLGKSASLVIDEDDIKKMNDTELEDCTEVLGKLNLEHRVKKAIWKRLKNWKETGNLMGLGGLVSALEEDDLSSIEINTTEPWALENLQILSSHIIETDTVRFFNFL